MEKKCIECGTELNGRQRKFCCKECWYKNLKAYQKEQYKIPEVRKRILDDNKKWYKDNREKALERMRKYLKKPYVKKMKKEYYENPKIKERQRLLQREWKHKINYASEKTLDAKYYRMIKARTKRKYPLINQKCFKCNNPAEEHHHTTKPIKVDKFEYVCKKCHKEIPKNYNGKRNKYSGGKNG